MDVLPHWCRLNHFGAIMHISFTDGLKNEDISKVNYFLVSWFLSPYNVLQVLLFVMHNVLLEKKNPLGYLLLCCLQSYLVIDMYAALEVHTEDTIAAGRKEILKFSCLIQVRCFSLPCMDCKLIWSTGIYWSCCQHGIW